MMIKAQVFCCDSNKLVERNLSSNENFDNLWHKFGIITNGNVTDSSRDFEMPLNHGFEIYFIWFFIQSFHFHCDGAYFHERNSLVLMINISWSVTFPNDNPLAFRAKLSVAFQEEWRAKISKWSRTGASHVFQESEGRWSRKIFPKPLCICLSGLPKLQDWIRPCS